MKEITISYEMVTGKTSLIGTYTPVSIKEIGEILNLEKESIRIVLKDEAAELSLILHALLMKKIVEAKVEKESSYDEKMYSDLKFFANVIPRMMITSKNRIIKHFTFVCS